MFLTNLEKEIKVFFVVKDVQFTFEHVKFYLSVVNPTQNSIKNKEILVSNDWGKLEKGETLYGSKSLLNMTLSPHHYNYVGWAIQLDGYHTVSLSYNPLLCFGSMLPIRFSVADMFKRSHPVQNFNLYNTVNFHFHVCHS